MSTASNASNTPNPSDAHAALDPQLTALSQRVARMTRLRRAERMDVERELSSHFTEAIASGRTPSEAIASFGDPKAAARELRAAAIAKRSPLDRALGKTLRVTGFAIAGAVLLYASFAAYLRFQAPVIKVDTLAALRDRLATPATPEDDAWPLYRRAFLALGLAAGDPERNSEGAMAVGEAPYPGMPAWNSATAWIERPEHQAALATLRAAAARPVFGFPAARELTGDDARLFGADAEKQMRDLIETRDDPTRFPVFGILLPHLAQARSVARMLSVDALRAAERSDGERFVEDIEAMVRMSVHVTDGRILIGDLVGMAVRSMAVERAVAALEWKPDLLDGAQLARLQRAFESVPPALDRFDLGAERLMWLDFEQRLWTDDGRGNGWFRPDAAAIAPLAGASSGESAATLAAATLSGPAAAMLVADRRTTHAFVEHWTKRFEDASALPLRDRATIEAVDREFEETVSASPVRQLLPRLFMPAFGQAAENFAVDRARRDAAAAMCAVLRFRADTGAWPTRAQDLVPKYLPSAPQDPWTGGPISMTTDAGGFRMTAAGADPTRPDPRIDWVWYAPRGNLDRWTKD
jgi:hypothetical protein